MDKINIVSSRAVLEMSSFSTNTCSMSSLPLVNKLVKNRLLKTAPDIDEPLFKFIHTINLSVVDTILHDSPDLVIHRTEIWAVWRSQVGRKKVWRFLTQQFNCCTCTVHCPAGTQSLPWTLRIAGSSMTSLWLGEAASKKSVRDITRISGFVTTMKLPHALQILTVFCEEVYVVAFFKVVQQQIIVEVGNSLTCLWVDNFCLQQWKNS